MRKHAHARAHARARHGEADAGEAGAGPALRHNPWQLQGTEMPVHGGSGVGREGAGPADPSPRPAWPLGLLLSGGHRSGPKRILQLPDVALHGFQALRDGRRRLESRHTWYGNLGTDGDKCCHMDSTPWSFQTPLPHPRPPEQYPGDRLLL